MNNNKKFFWLLFILLFLKINIFGNILILPFKTKKNTDKSYYWLSNALSFYVSTQLNSLNIRAYTEAEITSLMHLNAIKFPYRFTKASAIKIGLDNNATKIIWGSINILKQKKSNAEITIFAYIIDLKTLKQEYLPVIRGAVKNIAFVQSELLNSIMKKIEPDIDISLKNNFQFNNQSYELFIKSLLSRNITEKKHLLKNTLNIIKNDNKSNNNTSSDLVNFELALIYFDEGKYSDSNNYLNEINSESVFIKKKSFLKALIYANNEDFTNAIDIFSGLKEQNVFTDIIDNNLGVLYIKKGDYSKAETYLLKTINRNQKIIFYNNLLNLYLKTSAHKKMKEKIIEALSLYPKNTKYISVLYHFINKNKNHKILTPVFNEYIANDSTIDYYKLEFKLKLLNPFSISIKNIGEQSYKRNSIFENINILETKSSAFDNYLQNLEANPFDYKRHLLLSNKYKEKKQFRKAEIYAITAMFLNKSYDTTMNLVDIYNLLGDSDKATNLLNHLNKN